MPISQRESISVRERTPYFSKSAMLRGSLSGASAAIVSLRFGSPLFAASFGHAAE